MGQPGKAGQKDKLDRPVVSGRDLVERTPSQEEARVLPVDDGIAAGCKGKPAVTVAAVTTVVQTLQRKQPRGARFDEILALLRAALPTLSAPRLRRELGSVLKLAVGSKLLHRDEQDNYTLLHRHKVHAVSELVPGRGAGRKSGTFAAPRSPRRRTRGTGVGYIGRRSGNRSSSERSSNGRSSRGSSSRARSSGRQRSRGRSSGRRGSRARGSSRTRR